MLTEIKAPEGYVLNSDETSVTFTVSSDNQKPIISLINAKDNISVKGTEMTVTNEVKAGTGKIKVSKKTG